MVVVYLCVPIYYMVQFGDLPWVPSAASQLWAAVALPPLGAFGIGAAVGVLFLWVMPEERLVYPGLIRCLSNSRTLLRLRSSPRFVADARIDQL